jgi:uncharacterized protein (TIGR00290 family)
MGGPPVGTTPPTRVALAWSGGKDAALALADLRASDDVTVAELLTTREGDRTKAHRLRPDLLERQAAAAGLPIEFVDLPAGADNDAYEAGLRAAFEAAADRGVDAVAYADLYLEDVRAYRKGLLAEAPVEGRWPLWGADTDALARRFLDAGFAATLVAVEDAALGPEFAGMAYADALGSLPDGADPCGEAGAFHTFVTDGPVFDRPVPVEAGDLTSREDAHGGRTVHYRDLRPADG